MSRYTGPKLRKLRRFGEEFAVSADRSTAAKFVKSNRKQPPGAHGATQTFRKYSGYNLQLREKQKAKIYYHLTEKHMRQYYQLAKSGHGSASDNLLQVMESRLDNIIYRAGFANSHPAARQLINHKQFSLNGKKAGTPSILVKAGDKIEFIGKSQKLKDQLVATSAENKPSSWLKVDGKKLSIEVIQLPNHDEIAMPIDSQLIIEFYSK